MKSNLSVTGSATGNPRNKTALKPGYSLVGWIRLGSSGEDLTGLKGKTIHVSHQELAKHNKTTDCWMAVRGKVYNMTRYLDYHPGGATELMKGAGKDATSLFDEAHAYVNIDQLLAKCYVGPLRNTVTLNLKDSSSSMDLRGKLSPPSSLASVLKLPSVLSVSSEGLNKVEKIDPPALLQNIEIIPRFDWIQKTSELSIYYYTKSLCNPGVSIERLNDKEVDIKILIAGTTNAYKFSFLKSLKWPCVLKINQETGKIEIVFEKALPELWSNFGIYERTRTKDETVFSDFCVVAKNFFNRDSFELVLRPITDKIIAVPIGYHLNLRSNISGVNVVRSYTPVSFKYASDKAISSDTFNLLFLIKAYKVGTLSKFLSQKSSNETVAVSQPKGNLDLMSLRNHTCFAIMAAGSGITPMTSIIGHLLDRNTPRTESIGLYFFNKTESDIWLRDKFDQLKEKDDRLTIKHILSESSDIRETSDLARGRITAAIVEQIILTKATFVFLCGPPVFNDISILYLQDHDVDVHCFQG